MGGRMANMTVGAASAAVLMVRKRGAAPRHGKEGEHETRHGDEHMPPRWQRWLRSVGWAGVRTGVLFIVGLLGVLHETFAEGAERPTLLILFGAMLGLSIVSGGKS